MKVTVIIVTYNGIQWVKKCFESLINSSIELDIISIDNNSSDNTVNFIKENFPQVKVIEKARNLGFGKANNIGIEIAKKTSDYIYLLNQDAWVEESTIENIIKIQKKHPSYGILSPMQMNKNMTKIDKGLSVLCGEKHCSGFLSDLYSHNVKEVYEINSVMAAHWLISRECFLKIGGFAPIFKHYGEDDNYIHRAKYHGFKIGLSPNLRVVHDREDRVINSEMKIKGLIPTFLSWSCNINTNILKSLIFSYSLLLFDSLRLFVKTKSFHIFNSLLVAILNLPKILETRRITKKQGCHFL